MRIKEKRLTVEFLSYSHLIKKKFNQDLPGCNYGIFQFNSHGRKDKGSMSMCKSNPIWIFLTLVDNESQGRVNCKSQSPQRKFTVMDISNRSLNVK